MKRQVFKDFLDKDEKHLRYQKTIFWLGFFSFGFLLLTGMIQGELASYISIRGQNPDTSPGFALLIKLFRIFGPVEIVLLALLVFFIVLDLIYKKRLHDRLVVEGKLME